MTSNPIPPLVRGRSPAVDEYDSRYYFYNHPADRGNGAIKSNNISPNTYSTRSHSSIVSPDLARAFRVDAYLLAIIRIEDKRNSYYSTEVVSKLRQKEQTQSFINKPCSLFVSDRSLIIYDRGSHVVAESIPLENVDPTCVYADGPDPLNDIFMYRINDRRTAGTSAGKSSESSSVIVFKCSNKDSKLLVDSIRTANAKLAKSPRSARSETRSTIDRRVTDAGGMAFYDPLQLPGETSSSMNPNYVVGPQHTSRTVSGQNGTSMSADYYMRLTSELNKCFDDIELFVRYLEALMEYTKELARDHRRKDKKSTGLKQMVEKLPDDRFFVDVLQKFKHSFNLLGELKHIIHSPNAPELIHYLLSPLQFIVYTLRTKHPQQLQLGQDIWSPALTKEARELLANCLTSKEQEILKNLGPAWLRASEETPQRPTDYRPVFFEGRSLWIQEPSGDQPQRHSDERHPSAWSSVRQTNQNNNNNGIATNHNGSLARQPSPATHFDSSTIDRSARNGGTDSYHGQNEQAWAVERKRAGAQICAVKADRQGKNNKELTVRRGELVEIEDNTKKWWRARNFHGVVGHIPHNIVEEIEIDHRPPKSASSNPSVHVRRSSYDGRDEFSRMQQRNRTEHTQYLLRSPSHGDNFIMQSNFGASTNDHFAQKPPVAPAASTPPPVSPSFIPPPPPMPEQFLTLQSSSWSTLELPKRNGKLRPRLDIDLTTDQVDELQRELAERITDRVGLINEKSSADEVQRWLASKHYSAQLVANLTGMNGKELFDLTKHALDELTDENESNRLYAQLAQQKQLSGYPSDDKSERSPGLNSSFFGSLRTNTLRDADDSFSYRGEDTLNRSLRMKLKQRREKIEQAETVNPVAS